MPHRPSLSPELDGVGAKAPPHAVCAHAPAGEPPLYSGAHLQPVRVVPAVIVRLAREQHTEVNYYRLRRIDRAEHLARRTPGVGDCRQVHRSIIRSMEPNAEGNRLSRHERPRHHRPGANAYCRSSAPPCAGSTGRPPPPGSWTGYWMSEITSVTAATPHLVVSLRITPRCATRRAQCRTGVRSRPILRSMRNTPHQARCKRRMRGAVLHFENAHGSRRRRSCNRGAPEGRSH